MGFSSTPSPANLFLLFDSCQQSTPNSSSCQNANKQILMQQRIITRVLSDPHSIICSIGATEMYTHSDLNSDYKAQSPPTTWHSHNEIWLLCAGICQNSWERITWAAAGELLRWNSYKGSCLLWFLKLQVLLLNLCITLCLCLQLLKQNIVLNYALQLPHFTIEIIYTKLRHFLTSKFI